MSGQSRADIRRMLEEHGLRPRKALGQHFLADPNLVDKIIRSAGIDASTKVVEIGAGTGTLTAALAERAGQVVAYEVDALLRPVLHSVLAGTSVELRFQDALDIDWSADLDGQGWVMVANLPYNVGTLVLLEALRHASAVDRFVVMLQREVVRRLVAEPGSSDYGIPSVVVGLHAAPVLTFRVPPQVFVPPPAVDSEVVVLDRTPASPFAERAIELASAAFGQRRKMIRSSLRTTLADPVGVATRAGIDPERRAESLAPSEWLALAEAADDPGVAE